VETFAALLWRSRVDELRDADPVVGTLALHQLEQVGVFALRPRSAAVLGGMHCVGG